ncbi:phage minor head protein [Ancylobacter dichloromethanicus]
MSATEAVARVNLIAGLISLAAGGRIERGFPTPPEVLDYFRDKKLAPRFSWLDVWGEEHAHAFTVAGVLEERTLAEFRAGIDQALANGTGFDKFKADMEKRLKPIGWWGPRGVADPEGGKAKTVDFTRPKRLQTTFWSNVRAARAAGQWDRIQRTKRALPYILYVRTTAGDPRPEHLRWAGIILPVDHPFWRTHFPRTAGAANARCARSPPPRRRACSAARRRMAASSIATRHPMSGCAPSSTGVPGSARRCRMASIPAGTATPASAARARWGVSFRSSWTRRRRSSRRRASRRSSPAMGSGRMSSRRGLAASGVKPSRRR